MDFYYPRCIDRKRGGFFHYLRDDGSVIDADTRHLVSSCRYIFTFSMAARFFQRDDYLDAAHHGLRFLREQHRDPVTGGYAWILDDNGIADATRYCYGHMFVLLAYATALKAGISEAADYLQEIWELLERHFWRADDGLYVDEISADWSDVSPYRGQNANMHACEAMLAAFQATQDSRYLNRAFTLAHNIAVHQAAQAGGLIWEHYNSAWQPDWHYNEDKPGDRFKPWGFQVGHQTEWAKLLLLLERYRPEDWMLQRAGELFHAGVGPGWDDEYGGFYYGFAPDKSICDSDKYFWVQAETLATAAMLASRTGKAEYWNWYDKIWAYAWQHFVDHQYGAWFHYMDRSNRRYDDVKCPTGKTDYHTMGACYEVLNLPEFTANLSY
jgi:mannose/cellobiose epimerase-like protein (N-acyl-D-glucosamine 2-epimerase family)